MRVSFNCIPYAAVEEQWKHSFSLTSVIDALDQNGIPFLPYSDVRFLHSVYS